MVNKNLRELVLFAVIGVINTVVGCSVMFLLYNLLSVNYWLSSAANYVCGSICSFYLNKYITFASKSFNRKELFKFALHIAVCYAVSYGIARPMVRVILENRPQSLQDNIAMLTGSIVFTCLNFIGQKFFVFKKVANTCA